jgi:hypothetical protein
MARRVSESSSSEDLMGMSSAWRTGAAIVAERPAGDKSSAHFGDANQARPSIFRSTLKFGAGEIEETVENHRCFFPKISQLT